MLITEENYYSNEVNKEYWSVSQFKAFTRCEASAKAMLDGKIQMEKSEALLVGSYVDSAFDGTLEAFKEEHPEIYNRKGELYAPFKQADVMIARAMSDPKFMQYMSGQKQVIVTGELFGKKWRGKLDSYIPDVAIVDLKTATKIGEISKWNYPLQGAIYQALVEQQFGKKLPFYLAVVTKETEPDLHILQIPQSFLDAALDDVAMNIEHLTEVRDGIVDPVGCGECPWCRKNKKLVVESYEDYL